MIFMAEVKIYEYTLASHETWKYISVKLFVSGWLDYRCFHADLVSIQE